MRGVQFIFKTAEGLSWIMFSSEPMNLEFDTTKGTIIKSQAPFTGIIRLAHIPAKSSNQTNYKVTDSSTGLRRLIYHSGVYPTGGQVSWVFHSSQPLSSSATSAGENGESNSRRATITFDFATKTMIDTSHMPNEVTKPLLMLALPHQAELLSNRVLLKPQTFNLVFQTIKGPLMPVVGDTWSYDEPLIDIGFDGVAKKINPAVRRILMEQIDDDLGMILPTSAENIYGFGKQIARLAQLTHIAKLLYQENNQGNQFQSGTGIPEKAQALLSNYLEVFLSSQVTDRLLFDSNLGGLVSSNGLMDKAEDFGNGRYVEIQSYVDVVISNSTNLRLSHVLLSCPCRYNDHHFHYGYILYACAIMGKIDPMFLARFGPNVDAIFHDVAHPLNGYSQEVEPSNFFFPLARHKSWFDGHSFATGLFPFATGKSQESSSEAANCYYGAYLWSMVRHADSSADSDLTDFARLLLSTEIRSAKTYWHMTPPNTMNISNTSLYTPEFRENYMVGNLGMLDVTASTWFGEDPIYVHLINALPITALTAELFDKEYVKQEYPYLMEAGVESAEMAWRGYAVGIHAIIDPGEAWKEAQDLLSYQLDSGLSKSQLLYWISQRPKFRMPSFSEKDEVKNIKPEANEQLKNNLSGDDVSNGTELCSSHPECMASNLTGLCCPSQNSLFLDCCT
jgi:endo-1,3(4)-beta-glucanase